VQELLYLSTHGTVQNVAMVHAVQIVQCEFKFSKRTLSGWDAQCSIVKHNTSCTKVRLREK